MIRLDAFLHGLLDSQPDPERRRLLHRYLIWHLVRRMRSRNNGKPATRQQALLTRRLARGAIAFLDWLDAAGLTLENCQQADLDRWLGSGQAVYREEAGRLIRWAHAASLTSCYLPSAARWTGPGRRPRRREPVGHRAKAPARRRAQARGPPRRAARPPLRPGRRRRSAA